MPIRRGKRRFSLSLVNRLTLLILLLLLVTILLAAADYYALKITGATRAYTNEEGLWSKSQKEAVITLLRYAQSGDETVYNAFYSHLAVPLGDRIAREELKKENPDLAVVRSGFEQGLNPPQDVDDLIWLYNRLGGSDYGQRIIGIWQQQDILVERLITVAQELRAVRTQTPVDPLHIETLITELHALDSELTELEDTFSATLAEGSRELISITSILSMVIRVALLVVMAALAFLLALRVKRGIDGLKGGAQRVASGDYGARVELPYHDELGDLADDFNWMAGRLETVMGEIEASRERLQQSEAELRRYSQELKRSNQELEQFAFVASHDLKAPLASIAGFAQLLKRRYSKQLDQDAKEFIGFIVGDTERMQRLINDLLAFSRITTRGKEFAPVDTNAVLEQILHILERPIQESGAAITATNLPVVNADEIQLGQLWQNLLSNAIKFHGEKSPRIHIEARDQGDSWLFSVRDEGIGIDAANHERIFEMFQRLHRWNEYPGTGIGLPICKKIVERHGGRIWLESAVGQGTTFFFTLPKHSAATASRGES